MPYKLYDNSKGIGWIVLKFRTHIVHDNTLCLLTFQGQKSKVKGNMRKSYNLGHFPCGMPG